MPGPSSTLMGAPVVTTSAPGPRPEVSSYTWMEAESPFMVKISPISRWGPTRTTSDIGVRQARGHHQRSGYLHNLTAQTRSTFFHTSFAGRTSGATAGAKNSARKNRGFSSSPTVRRKKNIHHVRRSVYAVNNPRLSHLGRRPPVRAQAAGSGAEIPRCRPAREFSAGGFARRHISGKTAKRRQRRKSGAVSRKAPVGRCGNTC